MDYDVLILGGGIVGCAIAYELSKYSLNIALIEKDYDIADDISLINTSVVYDGVTCDDNVMAEFQKLGNEILENLTRKFKVPFKRVGSLSLAQNKDEELELEKMYNRAVKRNIKNIKLLNREEILKMEPNLKISVNKALYSGNTGIICPYDLALAFGEVAFDNGVKFKLQEKVLNIKDISTGFRVFTNKNKFTCKIVIDTIPSDNNIEDKIDCNKNNPNLRYYLLENEFKKSLNNMIFLSTDINNQISVLPTTDGSTVGVIPTNIDNEQILNEINILINKVENKHVDISFKSPLYNDKIVVDYNLSNNGYIKITGRNYSEVTMTPAIAKEICTEIVKSTNCKLKRDYIDKRREFYKFRELSDSQRNNIIKLNKKYGKIICTCRMITEGEVVEAIRRPLGARTLEGIRRRTGVTFGKCQGANCMSKIVEILANETNRNIDSIVKDSKDSKIVLSRIKEFDDM